MKILYQFLCKHFGWLLLIMANSFYVTAQTSGSSGQVGVASASVQIDDKSGDELLGILKDLENDKIEEVDGKKVNLRSVRFAFGKAELTSTDQAYLQDIAKYLVQIPTVKILVEGHTDNRGDFYANQRLSLKRAEAVKNYLITQNVRASQIEVKGYGSQKPIKDHSTEANRFENRRVELQFLGIADQLESKDLQRIELGNGQVIMASFILIVGDDNIAYKENSSTPIKKINRSEVKAIQYSDGSTYDPNKNPIVRPKRELMSVTPPPPVNSNPNPNPDINNNPPVPTPTYEPEQKERKGLVKNSYFFLSFGILPLKVNPASFELGLSGGEGNFFQQTVENKSQYFGYGMQIGIDREFGRDKPSWYTRYMYQLAFNSNGQLTAFSAGFGKILGWGGRWRIGTDFLLAYAQRRAGKVELNGGSLGVADKVFVEDDITVRYRNRYLALTPNISYDFPLQSLGTTVRVMAGFTSSLFRGGRVKLTGQNSEDDRLVHFFETERTSDGVSLKVNGEENKTAKLFEAFGPTLTVGLILK